MAAPNVPRVVERVAALTDLSGRAALAVYSLAARLAAPAIRRLLSRRAARGKEDPSRLGERFGRTSQARPQKPLVWLHGASVGEALSILPLLEALGRAQPDVALLITTGTASSAALLARRLPAAVVHQFAPVDVPSAVRAFLDHWNPVLSVRVESELWPNTLLALRERGIPALLVNGRMSDRSFRHWRRIPGVASILMRCFAGVLAQSEADADRFRRLGALNLPYVGNLKLSAPDLPCNREELASIRQRLGQRPVWVAASTHPGEESLIAEVHRQTSSRCFGLLTIIVPRHPERGPEIAGVLRAQGLRVELRSQGRGLESEEIYIADSFGDLGTWYRLSRVVFVGGSLVPHGGHNPIEPARLGCAVAAGPHMSNFREVADLLIQRRALVIVNSADELTAFVSKELTTVGANRLDEEALRREGETILATVTDFLSGWLREGPRAQPTSRT